MAKCSSGESRSCSCDHKEKMSAEDQLVHKRLSNIKHKLMVMSGKGGVGKSSVAVYLALSLANKGKKVGLLDVDLHGPSIPHLLGIRGLLNITPDRQILPHSYNKNLKVVSIECMMQDTDTAVIWRGPLKHGAIKQFIAEVDWGSLDYLIVDSPPGTGDEPLSVAQIIKDARAVIVTTPQEVSLADVRKSINFCRHVGMPILGLIENMSGLECPHCHKEIDIFKTGGGERTAREMNVTFLGRLPFELSLVDAGDVGKPFANVQPDGPFARALKEVVNNVEMQCEAQVPADTAPTEEVRMAEGSKMKIAIPLAEGKLTNHFGHCEQFAIIDVDGDRVHNKELVTPPPHEPGVLPKWLGEMGVNLIIAGGMGQRAISLFQERGVRVITGAPNLEPEELVSQYLKGTLQTGENVCDH